MSDLRETPPGTSEAQTVRRDRIRWGPLWAGTVTAVGADLFLQLALVATGIVEPGDSGPKDDAFVAEVRGKNT